MTQPSKKRALFLCPSPFEIGTYFRALAFARGLTETGTFSIDLICTSTDGKSSESMIEGVRILQSPVFGPNLLPMRGWNPGEILKRVSAVLRTKQRYDFIYSFEYQPSVVGLAFPLARLHHAVHFNDWCDWYAGRHHRMRGIRFFQKLDAWMEEFPRRKVKCVTTINSALYNRALASGVLPANLMLVREGAEQATLSLGKIEARRRLALRKFPLDNDALLAVAMLDQETEIHVSAISELTRLQPGVRLVLLGRFSRPSDFPASVLTPGRVSEEELDLWLQAADCAWLPLADTPLNRGRLPHKIGHFRMYGLPLLTPPVGDIPDLQDPGITLVENTGSAFAQATLKLGSLSESARAELQTSARRIYGWRGILEPLIQRILAACK